MISARGRVCRLSLGRICASRNRLFVQAFCTIKDWGWVAFCTIFGYPCMWGVVLGVDRNERIERFQAT
jgi:hypothetical protein